MKSKKVMQRTHREGRSESDRECVFVFVHCGCAAEGKKTVVRHTVIM